MNRNSTRICGRNTSTAPTPAISPSRTKLRSSPSGSMFPASAPSQSKPALIASIGGCAQENTAWNIRNSTASRIASPNTGCSSTASIRLVTVSGLAGRVTPAAMMRSASRCRARVPVRPLGAQSSPVAAGAASASTSSCSSSASVPPRRTAMVGTTGTPSSAERRAMSKP